MNLVDILKEVGHFLLKLPFLLIIGVTQFALPLKSEAIPFTRVNWIENFLPNWYLLVVK